MASLATPYLRIEILQGNGSETGTDVQLFDTETRTEFQLLLSNLSPPSHHAILVVVAPTFSTAAAAASSAADAAAAAAAAATGEKRARREYCSLPSSPIQCFGTLYSNLLAPLLVHLPPLSVPSPPTPPFLLPLHQQSLTGPSFMNPHQHPRLSLPSRKSAAVFSPHLAAKAPW